MNKKAFTQNLLVGMPFTVVLFVLFCGNFELEAIKETMTEHLSLKFSVSVGLLFQTISSFCVVNCLKTRRSESIIVPMISFSCLIIMGGFIRQAVNAWNNGFDVCYAPYNVPCLVSLLCCSMFVAIDSAFLFLKSNTFLIVNNFCSAVATSFGLLGMIIHSTRVDNLLNISVETSESGFIAASCFFCLGLAHLLIGKVCKAKT